MVSDFLPINNKIIKNNNYKKLLEWIPTIGVIIFFILYFYSTLLYPGGSQADLHSNGFDWVHNYWCDLLAENGTNGKLNPARPIAISAMIILALCLIYFFYQFAALFSENIFWKNMIQKGGFFSMGFGIMIFTEYHNSMLIIASVFGLFAMIGIVQGIYTSELNFYKITGLICIILIGICNCFYYADWLIEWLPLVQKITFLVVLLWVVGLSWEMIKKKESVL